ncbi:MAG: tRNA (adenosine(37)-N6)-threonylcarbamoyltransferase complex dimerization subunit type 1 TsaB [Bacilli bacterium]
MISLLLDSSSNRLSIALAKGQKVIASYDEKAFQTQSELLVAKINELLLETNIKPQAINNIVVAYGPGSFTGVRIAVNVAKIWAYALKINLYKVSSLYVYKNDLKPTICVLDARNNRSFAGIYSQNEVILEDKILTNDDVMHYVNEQGYALGGETKHLGISAVSYDRFANMLQAIKEENKVDDIAAFKPVYLKG